MSLSSKPEDRVLILAPTGKDAALISSMLSKERLPSVSTGSPPELSAQFQQGAALAIFAEEALIGHSIEPLVKVLREQPPWSDFPLIFLTGSGAEESETSRRLLHLLGPAANVTLLERPVRVATLLSGVRSAVRARRRQYEVREYIAERQRNDEKLLQTQKLESLGVLAGGVAHDFNNLLTGIMGNASFALDLLPPGCQSLSPILQDVLTASQSAADLTKQLLAYAGKGRFVIEAVNLSSAAAAVSHLIQSSIPPHVTVQLHLDPALPSIQADKTQVHQVIMNLLLNGAEAIPAGRSGTVHVTTGPLDLTPPLIQALHLSAAIPPGPYVQLEVRDDGAGMDEATRAKIFDPFFTTKFMGRGLGLAAALGIVHGHQGALSVTSSPGCGSTFRVFFPKGPGPGPSPAALAALESPPRVRRTVLVIDDEPSVRRIAKVALEREGLDVIVAANGCDGIDAFTAHRDRISAVLLDLTMPGMSGVEVLGRLKKVRKDIKVVISSGYNEAEVVGLFGGARLSGFIQKPYTASALARKIAAVLD